VLQAKDEVRAFRLRLVAAARVALANSLRLLGIQAPDVM
jgi:arginyl-tRNA synthetase